MRLFFFFFFAICLSGSVASLGIGVSPEHFVLAPGQKQSLFVSNPNDFDFAASLVADCPTVIIENSSLLVKRNSVSRTTVSIGRSGTNCTIMASFSKNDSEPIGLIPTVFVRISSPKGLSFYSPAQKENLEPNHFIGSLLSIAIVVFGLLVYKFRFSV